MEAFSSESSLAAVSGQVYMAYMESMAMVAAVQCDGNGSICFGSAAKAHVACQVPNISNHATTFGSICLLFETTTKNKFHTVAVCGQRIVTGLQADLQQRCPEGKVHVRMMLG